MKSRWALRALKIALLITAGIAVFGFVVMHLWNYLMPGLFGFRLITFWQAVAMMILGKLLFGGFRPRPGGMHWRRQMMRRWDNMTPEQREQFREGMRGRCGGSRVPTATPSA